MKTEGVVGGESAVMSLEAGENLAGNESDDGDLHDYNTKDRHCGPD